MEKNAIFGLEAQEYKNAKAVVIPVPYDSMFAVGGCRGGPGAIIEASQNLESYDNSSGLDISDLGIFTSAVLEEESPSAEAMIGKVAKTVAPVIKDKKVPIVIGGDHTVSLGAISALADAKVEFNVLQFDAHSGTRSTFKGSKYAHECTAARIREMTPCYTIDVRSGDVAGLKESKADMLTMVEMKEIGLDNSVKRAIRKTGRSIYISFNYDVMRLSDMPSVRTPEPGGLSYGKTIDMLAQLTLSKNVVGMDFIGLSPIQGFDAPNVLAAKLIQQALCYVFKDREEE
jgi:agmatinase